MMRTMRMLSQAAPLAAAVMTLAVAGPRAEGAVQAEKRAELKPQVKLLLDDSRAAYGKLKAYQHVATVTISGRTVKSPVQSVLRYSLAVERPGKFCFKCLSAPRVAAVSNGITFIHFDGRRYRTTNAPESIKDLPLVKDILFEPLGTYVVALMLQGDWAADSELSTAFAKASVETGVDEMGRRRQILVVPYGISRVPVRFFFDPIDHLLTEMTQTIGGGRGRLRETFQSVTKGYILDPTTFVYTPPAWAGHMDGRPPIPTEP